VAMAADSSSRCAEKSVWVLARWQLETRAHGDAINTAARLESANKQLGTRICASESVVEQAPGFRGRPIGTVMLVGKTEGIKVFEPLNNETVEAPAIKAYIAAFNKLEAGDPAANQAFANVIGQYGDDPLSTFDLRRILAGETGIRIRLQNKQPGASLRLKTKLNEPEQI